MKMDKDIGLDGKIISRGNDFAIPYGPFTGIRGKILNFSNNRMKLELKSIGLFLTVNIS